MISGALGADRGLKMRKMHNVPIRTTWWILTHYG
jgi:hypothetical protein